MVFLLAFASADELFQKFTALGTHITITYEIRNLCSQQMLNNYNIIVTHGNEHWRNVLLISFLCECVCMCFVLFLFFWGGLFPMWLNCPFLISLLLYSDAFYLLWDSGGWYLSSISGIFKLFRWLPNLLGRKIWSYIMNWPVIPQTLVWCL